MSHLKCHSIADNKESWENVPSIVADSMKTLNDNFKNVRRWALGQENALKEESLLRFELEQKLKQTNEKLNLAHQRLNFLFAYTNNLFARQRADCSTVTACLQQHLGATRCYWKLMGDAFGVDVNIKDPKKDELGDLQVLVHECEELGAQLRMVDEIFDSWRGWRKDQVGRIEALEKGTEELQGEATRTHDRLCTWRETIKENSWSVQNLSSMILETRGVVNDLCENRVTYDAMGEALDVKHRELEEIISGEMAVRASVTDKLDGRCDTLSSMIDMHVRETEDHMDRHSHEVMNIMQNNLTPVTQYLNSMHVKSDEVKAQLTAIQKEVPVLQHGLEEARTLIRQHEQERHNEFLLHDGRIEGLEESARKHHDQFITERHAWTSSIQDSKKDIDAQVDFLHEKLKGTDGVQEDHSDRMVNLDESLNHLQQKVAKWVHLQPLPVKVSEARLYALEARINEEIDRRLQLEARVETPATSRPHSRAAAASPMPPMPTGLPKLPPKSMSPTPPPGPPNRPPSADNLSGRKYSREGSLSEAELQVASTREKKSTVLSDLTKK
jgi:hypothetical protein